MIRPRKTLRRGEPTPAEKQEARVRCRERTDGMCESRESPRCLHGPLPLDGDVFQRGHLAHLHGKRRFGWFESEVQKHRWFCYWCHKWEHDGGNPVPAKQLIQHHERNT